MKKLESISASHTSVGQGNNKQGYADVKPGVPRPPKAQGSTVNVDGCIELPKPSRKVGVSKGITKSMGNYESLRVDTWLEDYIQDNETVQEAFIRIGAIIDNELQNQVDAILAE